MRAFLLLSLAGLGSASCVQLKATADAGYTQTAITGDIALSNTTGGGTINQDIESAFGLGQDRGSPYARVELDLGVPVLSVSGFTFDESGAGTLNAQFGNITAGTPVDAHLEFTNVKATGVLQIDLGPIAISPGVAVDLVDLRMTVNAPSLSATEEISVFAPVPMLFLRGEADVGILGAVAEVGWIDVPKVRDIEGTFWDAEGRVELRATRRLHLFAGYRMLHVDGSGTVDNQDFATNLDIAGWMIGGGIRF